MAALNRRIDRLEARLGDGKPKLQVYIVESYGPDYGTPVPEDFRQKKEQEGLSDEEIDQAWRDHNCTIVGPYVY